MLLSSLLAFLLPLTIAAAPLDDLDDEDAQIVQELYAEDAASAQYISPLRIYSQFSDGNETAVLTNTTASKPAVWACDVRSWVRAPDMFPGATVPAEVRLAMNGSACADVVSWGVGLSMKERGAMKVKAPNATLPIAPTQDYRSSDRGGGSIYTDSLSMMRDEVYHQEYIAYQKALADPALWIVKGLERVAFDAQLDMPSLEDPSNTDVIVPFHAHCPDTNLPPILDQHEPYVHFGEEGTFINAESRFEYRILLHLSNGTIIAQSAGQAGFLPDPVYLDSEINYLNGTMVASRPTEDNTRNYDPAPECDHGSLARFNISVASNSLAVPGTSHTFNVTITRFGNGTEHPSSLDLSLTVERNETWAFEYIDYETYMNATGKRLRHDGYRRWSSIRNQPQLLAAKTDAQLEEERDERQRLRDTDRRIIHVIYPESSGARVELSGEMERYDFEMELPISLNAFPSVNRSLVSYRPSVEIRLNTYFACASVEEEQEAPVNEWDEFKLPLKPKSKSKSAEEDSRVPWRSSCHSALMPIDIMRLPSDANERSDSVRDYRDPLARAPILTLSSARPDLESFPLLNQEIREEPVEEIRQSKYGWYFNNLLCQGVDGGHLGRGGCFAKDPGGTGRHAAKVWQRKERVERGGK